MTGRSQKTHLCIATVALAAVVLFSMTDVRAAIRMTSLNDPSAVPGCPAMAADCEDPPVLQPVASPPVRSLPAGAPTAAVCGTCTNPAGGTCFSDEDCSAGGVCQYCIPGPGGPCSLPETDTFSFVDARCFPRKGAEPDDTCRLKRAAAKAAGRVLWIADDSVFEVSWLGATSHPDACFATNEYDVGIPIPSHTIVAGGGTIRLHVDPAQRVPEQAQGNYLLKVQDATDVTITGITFDGNAGELQCPNSHYEGNPAGACTHKHAIAIWDSTDVTVAGCSFMNLVGDGVYVNGYTTIPARLWIHHNVFATNPFYRNRNGVSVARAYDLRVENNTFNEMARKPMPGAIDLEANLPSDRTQRVIVSGNEITGWAGCFNTVGISASNNVNATYSDILFADNHVTGCHQIGINVGGAGTVAGPVVVRDNVIETASPPLRNEWAVAVSAKVVRNAQGAVIARVPSHAFVRDNQIRMQRVGRSSSAIGIAVWASGAIVEGNLVEDAKNWGIMLDERYDKLPGEFTVANEDERMFCSNTLERSGTPGRNDTGGFQIIGSNNEIIGNHVQGTKLQPTPQGARVMAAGTCNQFRENNFGSVTNCSNQGIGCIECVSGCQWFSGNTAPPGSTITTCASCP